MYAIFVGTRDHYIMDSIYDEREFVVKPGDDIFCQNPAVMNRLSVMATDWSRDGRYIHPLTVRPETESLLGYTPGDRTASETITHFERDGFFVMISRENRNGEIHLWNTRWSAIYEFNRRFDDASWYVRTLGFPATLLTFTHDGSNVIKYGTATAKSRGFYRVGWSVSKHYQMSETRLNWTNLHLHVLSKRESVPMQMSNVDRKASNASVQ
jgi:hypothetical protein